MNKQSQWLFEAPASLGTGYINELEYEQLETNVEFWNESSSAYLGENVYPYSDDPFRWPKQTIFKVPPAETIKSGPYQTALCPTFNDFLELRNLVRDLRSQLETRPTVPKGLRDPQALKRWRQAIEAWEKNIKQWGKQIELLILKMIKQLQNKSYAGRCTKVFWKDLAKKVNALRGPWTRSGTMLDVRQTIDKRLVNLRNVAVRAAK
jgi:hypothetical protein